MTPLTQVPICISDEATRHVAALGLKDPLRELIEKAVETIHNLRRLEISLQYSQEGDIPCILFDGVVPPADEELTAEDVKGEDAWYQWRSAHYPPHVFQHFVLLVIPDFPDAR